MTRKELFPPGNAVIQQPGSITDFQAIGLTVLLEWKSLSNRNAPTRVDPYTASNALLQAEG